MKPRHSTPIRAVTTGVHVLRPSKEAVALLLSALGYPTADHTFNPAAGDCYWGLSEKEPQEKYKRRKK